VQYQAKQVVSALELAVAKAQFLLQAVALREVQAEVRVELLLQELEQVLRQALALEQFLAQEQEVPLLQLGVPQEVLQPMEALVQRELEQVFQRALAEAEAQVEVLEPQVRELVQVPLLEAE
jgi:hypothetical protein